MTISGRRVAGTLLRRGDRGARRRRQLVAGLAIAAALTSAGRAPAGLLTDFAASYAQYEQCVMSTSDHDMDGDVDGVDFMMWQRGRGLAGQTNNMQGDADGDTFVLNPDLTIWKNKFGSTGGLPASTCFKLYLDPQGVVSGSVTLFVDAVEINPGEMRFGLGNVNGLFQTDPRYKVQVLDSLINVGGGRQRIEAKIRFDAVNPLNPPVGPVTIFGFQVQDLLPETGVTGVQAGFDFKPGDFVSIFDTTNGQTTVFNDTQLDDVNLSFERGFLHSGDVVKAIDVDPLASNSSYAPGEGPLSAYDQFVNTKYRNDARRNAGFIAGSLTASPTIVRSMGLRSALDTPLASDPVSYELYGTNSMVISPDNSSGSLESWTLIASGPIDMPETRGNATGVTFDNSTPYHSYRVVFPDIRDFRAADSMQVADISLYESTIFSPPNVLDNYADPRAIQLPTPQADSPPNAGPEKMLDGDGRTKYQMLGKQNSGFIITPAIGPTMISSFVITTAGDTPACDPASYILYGTNDPIISQNFSQGTAENWTQISAGTLALPDERLAAGPRIAINSLDSYLSYRLVFPTMKNASSPAATSIQFSDIQFYRYGMGLPATPTPEPATLGLAGCMAAVLVWFRSNRTRRRP